MGRPRDRSPAQSRIGRSDPRPRRPGQRRDARPRAGARRRSPTRSAQAIVALRDRRSSRRRSCDDDAGAARRARGGQGGPRALSRQEFYLGINDPLGGDPHGRAVHAERRSRSIDAGGAAAGETAARGAARRDRRAARSCSTRSRSTSPASRAERRARTRRRSPAPARTCHDTPNVGNHSVAGAARHRPHGRRRGGRPTCRSTRCATRRPARPSRRPTRAARCHRQWEDIGRFKGPILRGLAARAPYFHNGSAATLDGRRPLLRHALHIGLTDAEVSDLVAFLKAQ